ncbi:DUF4123 domain-containing protein [Litoreibacter arenae]|uniref:DUF4123 domain-containing protein n=1 Tax=Litoreibacter arenae DSM 19593 TaxID=1123360 RepID=S9QG85_9RHOB|nr:DUF4123 domain-containing protein [Litoreibacter arenae]EPX78583.1 hypothetical protein thalar_02375 [Litoreibacter arenae DSM 19593]
MGPYCHHSVSLVLAGPDRRLEDNPELEACLFGTPDWSGSGKETQTFVLLEAARFFGLPEMLETSGLEYGCLFQGGSSSELADVAPYLLRLTPDAELLRHLLSGRGPDDPPWQMWPRAGACFLRSAADLTTLIKHFRKFTRVFDERTGRWNYFRFYAPEVMLSVVANMERAQFERFTKGIDYFAVPNGTDNLAILRLEASVPIEAAAAC